MTLDFILRGIHGSTAHGLAREGSDEDFLGAYVMQTRDLVGLSTPSQAQLTYSGHDPFDFTYHEIGKYMNLALKANPTALELLWLESYTDTTMFGRELVARRNEFLSAEAVRNAFKGYAMEQMTKARNGNLTAQRAKNARHMFRLLDLGYQLKTTGDMTLRVANPQRFFDLEDMTVTQWMTDFEKELTKFEEAPNVLPAEPNRAGLNDLLVKFRKTQW